MLSVFELDNNLYECEGLPLLLQVPAFPARSPIPLIVPSTCVAPSSIAASELAVAMPKSS